MRHYELPPEEAKKLISSEKANTWQFRLVHAGVWIAIVGAIGFMLAFFYQKPINATGLPYRQAQLLFILIVFAGWMIFNVSCTMLGINIRKLNYKKLVSILKNQVEVPFDEQRALRKQVALALVGLSDDYAFFPAVFADDPARSVPALLTGPGGVLALHPVHKKVHDKDFVDPAKTLMAGSAELEKRLKHTVIPVVTFLRNRKGYEVQDEAVKAFTLPELYAYIESRKPVFQTEELKQVEREIRYFANLPREPLQASSSTTLLRSTN